MKKKMMVLTSCVLLGAMLFTGCSSPTTGTGKKPGLSYDEAAVELKTLTKSLKTQTVSKPVLDIYSDEVSEAEALADIDTFPITVKGDGRINIEIAGATEMTAEAPDDWLNMVARDFNKSGQKINGKTVTVSVRKITSGEVLTYVKNGVYKPHVYIPSNYAWGEMLRASGIDVTTIEERIAGNTAGILIKKDIYDKFIEKYKEATVGNVLDATLNGDLIFAYTNPYTSSTGLNILTCMLKSFDENDPLSETASEKLLRYQQSSPPVAYTTAVLRNSAAKGVINAMVMEEQAYVNTPELKGYVFVPAGIRHDHPVYTFDWDTEEEVEAAKLFTEYCKSDAAQKLATEKGFNRHDDYEGQDTGMTGTDYLNAQKVWKQNKNGGKPILAVFVADVSGSMDGTPINSLKSSLVNALPYISEDHYIGLVSYSGGVTVNLPIEKFDPTQRAYFSGEVKNLSAGGQTATYDALLVALKMLEDKAEEIPDAKKMVFLLTDGAQNQGYTFDRVEGIVEGLQVPVYSIAYNYSGDGDLEKLSGLVEASVINSSSDDIANQIRNLFNVNL